MTRRLAPTAFALMLALPAGTHAFCAPREAAKSTGRDEGFASLCEPPLKFAAGACVRDCPAGYRDTGLRTCSFQRTGD